MRLEQALDRELFLQEFLPKPRDLNVLRLQAPHVLFAKGHSVHAHMVPQVRLRREARSHVHCLR